MPSVSIYLGREVVENVADGGGRTHIGEEGPPHQGEETRHFEVLWRLSTASRESVWELRSKHEDDSARLRPKVRQRQKNN